jgi:hypothetical protein
MALKHDRNSVACMDTNLFYIMSAWDRLHRTATKSDQDQRLCHHLTVREPIRKHATIIIPEQTAKQKHHVCLFLRKYYSLVLYVYFSSH